MKYSGLDTESAHRLQNGGLDANGQVPEQCISDGRGNPCRHCLKEIAEGAPMLILAHRPFDTLQPYAETGPVFLCALDCQSGESHEMPQILRTSPDYLVKGYDASDRIIYGTGAIVASDQLESHAALLLKDAKVAYLHVRSARNNCYQLRIDR